MFQDFGARTLAREYSHSPATPPAEQAASLIGRYPDLTEPEVARLIDIYRRLSAMDEAMIMSDETLGPKLDRFFSDHRSGIRTPVRQYAALLAIAATGLLVTFWALIIS